MHIINESFSLQTTADDFMQMLAERINYLIVNDFDKLIAILYRADVSEKKLNAVLSDNKNEDAGKLIAGLFVHRQAEKLQARNNHRNTRNTSFNDEDPW